MLLSAKKNAKAYIPVSTYNFGTISLKDTINYNFKIKNIGENPLVINKIESTCNCTYFKYDNKPVFKNKELIIKSQFIPKKNKLGKNTASILIESNFEDRVIELKLEGIVTDSQ